MNIKKFLTVFIIAAVMMAVGCASGPIAPKDEEQHLVILNTNDHHGHPVAFFDYPASDQGGIPARATFIEKVKMENPNVLVVDAGDINTGRPESNFFKAEADIIGYNMAGYDLLTMGNHEFDNDFATMQEQIALSEFPWLCANVVNEDGSYIENVQPYVIKEYPTFKVAVLGLMSKYTAETGNPEFIKGYAFRDEVEVAKELVPKLQKKADIVIAVVHMGIYDETKGSMLLAKEVPGIAMIVDGHTHTKTEEPVWVTNAETGNDVAIVSSKHWGLYMGKTDLTFMNGEVTGIDFELAPINVRTRVKDADGNSTYPTVGEELEKNQEILAVLQTYVDKVDAVLSEVIGNATDVFPNDNTRKMETAIGDIVTDSQKWFIENQGMECDFAFQNGGGIRATLGSGEIQKQTVYEVLPFDNSIALIELKGSDVTALFEKAATNIGAGAMAQVSKEVKVVFDSASKTLVELAIDGMPVDPDKVYKIALNSYLAAGGDGYDVFKNQLSYYDTSLMQRDAFIDYVIHLGGTISPMTDGRITIK
ncbi:MAG: 5'-nucleotidase C-terminal domain-containing protein [Spirochaetales bacterium]|nr:5'-nucleotidase C-terminal domain-containing protein [Spirochaetales bacterium]